MTTRMTVDERRQLGKAARAKVPRSSHADWAPASDRPDPVAVVEQQNSDRIASLVPIRHGRMLTSPFSFYRGAAAVMAADLATRPTTGIDVQVCGDAHLSNLGVFATPERTLVFDINDFDETLPGPWEWDVKRLAASVVVAGRHNGFDEAESRRAALRSVRAYQRAMGEFAEMSTLAIWYSRLEAKDIVAMAERTKGKKAVKRTLTKATRRNSLRARSKLAAVVNGEFKILADPPYVVPLHDAGEIMDPAEADELVQEAFHGYVESLSEDRKMLLSRYRIVDVAHKVVGVGSVGTRCFIALLEGRDHNDPLFLQAKEASPSVLENHLPQSVYEQQGQRVVEGQRLIQAASDTFLGWVRGRHGRDFYFRQLRDMKGSADVEAMDPRAMTKYAGLCGWTLARGHSRSGDPVAIAGYLGTNDTFASAVAEFARRYADQNEVDYTLLREACATGRLETVEG